MSGKSYWVYILASQKNGTLYIGVTNSLSRRIRQHREGIDGSFTAQYRVSRLVYFEEFSYVDNAIAREKQLKAGSRIEKIALIEKMNPEWLDRAEKW